ncbi:MAG: universal stress protein, partial [Thermodesulfobacteriota bacterium]|nr:universal stress protein [Thermodesulfobacteriota bacterium]
SEKAFDFLLKLKGIIGELEIVHIIRKKLTARDMRKLNKKLSDTRTTCLNNKIDAEYHIYAGEISEEIIAAARDYKATCIIMGTRRKNAMSEFFSSKTAYHVVRKAHVPTLIVP